MKDDRTGGPAFPIDFRSFNGVNTIPKDGMTLRDWFAGQALQGFCANVGVGLHSEQIRTWIGDATARDAYSYADAMLTEKDKEE